jgi:hypothetical protein
MPADVLAPIARWNLALCPMRRLNRIGAIGVGDQATGDLTA